MNRILIATGNANKVREISHKLAPIYDEILSMKDAGITHDVVEDGETFYENARKKACEIGELAGIAVLADDSGLVVEALGGAPGVYSARYSGEHDDAKNLALLLKNVASMPAPRRAWFVSACALWRPGHGVISAVGTCEGQIIDQPRGRNGFGYDPVFFDVSLGQTFAEITLQHKNTISHRARSLDSLMRMLLHDSSYHWHKEGPS